PLPASLDFAWKVPPNAPDFIRARAVVTDASGRVLDAIETGFCVRDPKVIASGARIRYRDNGFDLKRAGKPVTRTTLFGTDTYGNMLLSPSCSPLTWYRDIRAMRDHGLHMFENLQYPPTGWKYTEAEWRKMDAMIQLAQRFGLPYMAGLLIGVDVAVDDATLAAQAAMCRSFAERYRRVPGLIYYLNGDFRLDMKDTADLRRIWNDLLRRRYGTNDALRAAWGAEAVADPLGEIRIAEFASVNPFSERARDTRLFQATLVERWVSALTHAIREVDRDHPITGEYYQRPIAGIDLRLTMDGMDAANIGYFGPPRQDIAQLLATIKWNDMRRAGKTVNLGEFGVKTHDAWAQQRDPFGYHIGRTEEEQRRQVWWIVHAALAYDVTKIQNWCWADDPDSVFPWGVAYNNPLRPKPALRLWRNLRFVSELMPHADEPAQTVFVMPDSWRLGAPEPAAWTGVASALECLLATNVRFDVVNEASVPPSPRPPPAQGGGGANSPSPSTAPAHAIASPLTREARPIPSPLKGEGKGGGEEPHLIVAPSRVTRSPGHEVTKSPGERPGLIVAPFASRMSEEAQRRLLELARQGATVYVSEPPQHGPIADAIPPPADRAAPLGGGAIEPSADMTRIPVGQGSVIVSRQAWESMPGHDVFVLHPEATADPARNRYLDVVKMAGVEPDAMVESQRGVWRATARKADGRTLIALFARSVIPRPMPVTVRASGHIVRWSAAGNWPCLVVLDRNGGVLAATGGGTLSVDGRQIGGGDGPWLMASADGKPLSASIKVVISMTNGGELHVRSSTTGARASVVEMDGAGLRRIGAAEAIASRDGWRVRMEPNDLVLVTARLDTRRVRRYTPSTRTIPGRRETP
ncbi:MAG: hypothetical protein FJX72_12625, partial [Armatimonadetes bacterium]|nr:hypothetical protein [Armatimonadota bacterium]